MCRLEFILNSSSMWDGTVVGVEIPRSRSIDIDDELDFSIAKFLMETNEPIDCLVAIEVSVTSLITGTVGRNRSQSQSSVGFRCKQCLLIYLVNRLEVMFGSFVLILTISSPRC